MLLRFILPVLVFIGGATGLFVYQKDSPSTATSTPQVIAATSTPLVTATVIKTNLSVTPKGEGMTENISSTKEVEEGDTLKTSVSGRGVIEMQNGSTAVLDYDSSMTIEKTGESGNQTSLAVQQGSVWARVKKVFGQGEFFEIRSQNAVAVVRGTSFGFTHHKDGSSTILVASGLVKLIPLDPATGKELPNKAIEVSAGSKGTVSKGGAVTKSNLTLKEKQSEWYLFNTDESLKTETKTEVKTEPKRETPVTEKKEAPTQPKTETPTGTSSSSSETGSVCGNVSEEGFGATSALAVALKITSVVPAKVTAGAAGEVTLKGTALECVVSVTIGESVLTEESELTVTNSNTISFPIKALSRGTFDITIVDTVNRKFTLPRAIVVE